MNKKEFRRVILGIMLFLVVVAVLGSVLTGHAVKVGINNPDYQAEYAEDDSISGYSFLFVDAADADVFPGTYKWVLVDADVYLGNNTDWMSRYDNARQLTFEKGNQTCPFWTPDGSIMFLSESGVGPFRLWSLYETRFDNLESWAWKGFTLRYPQVCGERPNLWDKINRVTNDHPTLLPLTLLVFTVVAAVWTVISLGGAAVRQQYQWACPWCSQTLPNGYVGPCPHCGGRLN